MPELPEVESARTVIERAALGRRIVDVDDSDPSAAAFIDLRSTQARRIALEILAAADDADWQTEQDGCPEPTR